MKKTRDKKAKQALVLHRETLKVLATDPGALLGLAGANGEPISGGWGELCPTWPDAV